MNIDRDEWLTPRQKRQRVIATVLAVCVLVIAIVVLYAAWWKPWQTQHARLQQLLERRDRVEAVLQSRSAVEAALQRADQAANREPLLQPEPTRDQAMAGMMQRFQELVTTVGGDGKGCRIESQTPGAPGAGTDLQRTAVNVRLRCGNSEWLQLAQAMEAARPALFIDELNIAAPPDTPMGASSPQQGALDISMMVYGFSRQTAAPASGAAN